MKEIDNPYSERTILLGLIIKLSSVFDKVHLVIDGSEELGFQKVLCMHHHDTHKYPKTFTWHISDEDLKLLPDRIPDISTCDVQYYSTQEKYENIIQWMNRN